MITTVNARLCHFGTLLDAEIDILGDEHKNEIQSEQQHNKRLHFIKQKTVTQKVFCAQQFSLELQK